MMQLVDRPSCLTFPIARAFRGPSPEGQDCSQHLTLVRARLLLACLLACLLGVRTHTRERCPPAQSSREHPPSCIHHTALLFRHSALASALHFKRDMSAKQRAVAPAAATADDDDDDATQATTQDSQWRAGVNRQAQPQALEHQHAASQAAAVQRKRKAAAVPEEDRKQREEERKRKAAEHMKEVRAQQKSAAELNRAEADAAAQAARPSNRANLNIWLKKDAEERCSGHEWAKFKTFLFDQGIMQHGEEVEDQDIESIYPEFIESWRCDSDECKNMQTDCQMQARWGDLEDVWGEHEPAQSSGSPQSCERSPPPPDDDDDPYGGYSQDMCYDKPGDSGDESQQCNTARAPGFVRVSLRVRYDRSIWVRLRVGRLRIDYENDYEQRCEHELARQERLSRVTGKPWHEVPDGSVLWHWTDDLGSASHPLHGYSEEARARIRAVNQRCKPPPQRSQYGSLTHNPQGDAQFRRDRAEWYEEVTGESLHGVSLAEQWRRVHRVARSFRADTRDGRPGTSRNAGRAGDLDEYADE